MRRAAVSVGIALLLLGSAACGGDDSDGASGSPSTTAAPAGEPSAVVSIADFTFAPEDLEVATGTEVTVSNDDTATHTLTADDGSFDTGELASGESATVTVDKTTTYHCEIHDYMRGTLTVA